MEKKTIEKTFDMANNISKIAANLTDKKPIPIRKEEAKNSTGSQSVIVSVDKGPKKDPKPITINEHIFPENRPLTEEECDMYLKKAQMEYDLKMSKQAYFEKATDRDWQHQIEQEKKDERKTKIRRVIGGLLVALGVSAVGYSIYSDYRDNKNSAVDSKTLPEGNTINAEGTVK